MLKETAFGASSAALANSLRASSSSAHASGASFAASSLFPRGAVIGSDKGNQKKEDGCGVRANLVASFLPHARSPRQAGAEDARGRTRAEGERRAKGVEALGTLCLTARVYLRLCLALPPDLAASLIQVPPSTPPLCPSPLLSPPGW
jgi:hypothetical protein